MDINQTLRKYKSIKPRYDKFTDELHKRLNELLSKANIKIYNIEKRTKSLESVKNKIIRKKYQTPLENIKDFSGLRIIHYYQKDYKKILKILKREFKIIENIQKPSDHERFGYRGYHYIVSINENCLFPNGNRYRGLVAEIQVCTVLAHAWNAVSHNIYYKKEPDLPVNITRRLLSISALLEVADNEFSALRKEEAKIKVNMKFKKSKRTPKYNINSINLFKYFSTDSVHSLIECRLERFNIKLSLQKPLLLFGDYYADEILLIKNLCHKIGINHILLLERIILREIDGGDKLFKLLRKDKLMIRNSSIELIDLIITLLVASNLDKLDEKILYNIGMRKDFAEYLLKMAIKADVIHGISK
ncbi:MAG: hypothetical protein HZA77_16020 [Candidatus Schekmanbacteria bacterium]|nr:hypothetical protein [Candidatus Schekmanbacteria bacterium]